MTGSRLLTVLLIEDDATVRADTRRVLAFLPDAQILEANSLNTARGILRRHHVHLAIVDVGLPDGSGLALVEELTREAPADGREEAICVIYTVFDDDVRVIEALAAGAHGYLVKGDPVPVMQERLAAVLRGEPVVSPVIARRVLKEFLEASARSSADVPSRLVDGDSSHLTQREHDVLHQIATGRTVAEVARLLDVSTNTVKTHLKSIYVKLGVRTRVRAVNVARDRGLLDDRGASTS